MHNEFQEKFKQLTLSFSEVEAAIGCPKNYLSRFINGPQTLPAKWETKIRTYLIPRLTPEIQLDDAIEKQKEENEQLKLKIKELEGQLASAQQKTSTKNGLDLSKILAEAASQTIKK